MLNTALRKRKCNMKKKSKLNSIVANIFCPTGAGGGINPTCPVRGAVSRTGTPNARPESGQFPPQATVQKTGSGAVKEVKPKKAKQKVQDHPEAEKVADRLHTAHKDRIKGAKEPEQVQASFTQFKNELDSLGVVATATGYGFKKGFEV